MAGCCGPCNTIAVNLTVTTLPVPVICPLRGKFPVRVLRFYAKR